MPRQKRFSDSESTKKRQRTNSAGSRNSVGREDEAGDNEMMASKLEPETYNLIHLLFNDDIFTDTLIKNGIDVEKLPVSKLKKKEIEDGLTSLYIIKDAIDNDQGWETVEKLTADFYNIFPYFIEEYQPLIMDLYDFSLKKYTLQLMLDFELLESRQSSHQIPATNGAVEACSVDDKYNLLKCQLKVEKKSERNYKIIEKYVKSTAPRNFTILGVWHVDRDGEADGFKEFDTITNRRLLWHEPDHASVVAADLCRGLIIRPHSERKVGNGIYFSSEDVQSNLHPTLITENGEDVGFMYLAEVALGKEKDITVADYSYIEAPAGYDSVVARGSKEPYPRRDATIVLDEKEVLVPQAPPVRHYQFKDSFFNRSLYVIYKKNQARLRFLIKYKMAGR